MKHTPTPWHIEQEVWIVPDCTPRPVANTIPHNRTDNVGRRLDIDEANAAFIVRAVNVHEMLLEACRDMLNELQAGGADTPIQNSWLQAIAKAEGK